MAAFASFLIIFLEKHHRSQDIVYTTYQECVYTSSERYTMQLQILFYCKIDYPITANIFSLAIVI